MMELSRNKLLQFKSIKTGKVRKIGMKDEGYVIHDNKALDNLPMTSASIKVDPNVCRNTR